MPRGHHFSSQLVPQAGITYPKPRAGFNYNRSIEGWTSRSGVGGSCLSAKPGPRQQLITPTGQGNRGSERGLLCPKGQDGVVDLPLRGCHQPLS